MFYLEYLLNFQYSYKRQIPNFEFWNVFDTGIYIDRNKFILLKQLYKNI